MSYPKIIPQDMLDGYIDKFSRYLSNIPKVRLILRSSFMHDPSDDDYLNLIKHDCIDLYTYPVVSGSTAGPGGGIGGQMMTSFQMYALVSNIDNRAMLICCGRTRFVDDFKIGMSF